MNSLICISQCEEELECGCVIKHPDASFHFYFCPIHSLIFAKLRDELLKDAKEAAQDETIA